MNKKEKEQRERQKNLNEFKEYKITYQNKEYSLGQHGFARDSEFTLVEKCDNKLSFELLSNDEQ